MNPSRELKDVAASVRQRLLNHARKQQADFNMVLQQYGAERFLYRLGISGEVDRFTLKGASLFMVWTAGELRPTRDVDLLSFGTEEKDEVRRSIENICAVACPEDGLEFDKDSISLDDIRDEHDYGGLRAKIRVNLGQARIALQVDIGFGDVIIPERAEDVYPVLLAGLPTPRVWMYPRETFVAEKFEAMVRYGLANSRMKDFWDVSELARCFDFEGATLQSAVEETFRRRGTRLGDDLPEALRPAFYNDEEKKQQWLTFKAKVGVGSSELDDFEATGELIRDFLAPIRESIVKGELLLKVWPAGGPWKSGTASRVGESIG